MPRAAVLLFDAFFVILIAAAVLTAWEWPFATGLFPLTIGIPVLTVAVGQLVKDWFDETAGKSEAAPGTRIRDIEVDRSIPIGRVAVRAGSFYACALGFFALILLVGFKLAVPVFMVAYMQLWARAKWFVTLVLAALMSALVVGVFDNILHISWPDSLLGPYLGIH